MYSSSRETQEHYLFFNIGIPDGNPAFICQQNTNMICESHPSHLSWKKGEIKELNYLLHIHRNLLSDLCFSSCMKFSFRGHSCGFTPSTGIHFPSLGLNRAGHDTSLTIVTWGPGTILVLMCSQFVQKWYILMYGFLSGCNHQSCRGVLFWWCYISTV